jgi:hypothetical protein
MHPRCIFRKCEACEKLYGDNSRRIIRKRRLRPKPQQSIDKVICPRVSLNQNNVNSLNSSPRNVIVAKDTMKCPIGHEIMTDPVIAEDGITYERKNIERWLNLNLTSPVTRDPISSYLIPNYAIKQIIDSRI